MSKYVFIYRDEFLSPRYITGTLEQINKTIISLDDGKINPEDINFDDLDNATLLEVTPEGRIIEIHFYTIAIPQLTIL